MNFLQLAQTLRQEAGISGSGPTTTLSQVGEYKRLVDWINIAWLEIQQDQQAESWRWMRSTFAFQTIPPVTTTASGTNGTAVITVASATGISAGMMVSGIYIPPNTTVVTIIGTTVTLSASITGTLTSASLTFYKAIYSPTDAGIASTFAKWKPETFRIYLNSAGYGTETKLIYIAYEDWRDVYELGPRITGRPLHVTVKPDLTIGLGPYPSDAYIVNGDYVIQPTTLAADTDTPGMPSQYHLAIVYRALMSYAVFEAAGEIYAEAEKNYEKMMGRLATSQLPELLSPPAMV